MVYHTDNSVGDALSFAEELLLFILARDLLLKAALPTLQLEHFDVHERLRGHLEPRISQLLHLGLELDFIPLEKAQRGKPEQPQC